LPTSTTAVGLPSNAGQALTQLDAAYRALAAARSTGDLGKIGVASQALDDAVSNYLRVAGTALTTPRGTPAPTHTSAGG